MHKQPTYPSAVVQRALERAGDGSTVRETARISGGDISAALRVRTAQGEYLLKYGQAREGFFMVEARGLALLRSTGVVRVPDVLAHDDDSVDGGFILLEWLAAPPQSTRERAAASLGTALAELHRVSAHSYGLDHDNYIGTTPQRNGWMERWIDFFRERRLLPQIELARRNGHLDRQREASLARVIDALDTWIDEDNVQPALLHGDLWGGNFIVGPGGAPALIDPAVYYGDREADLALAALFGGFPAVFGSAYNEAWPLADGWRERRDVYNVYHLLNHLNMFGEGYGGAVDTTVRRLLATRS